MKTSKEAWQAWFDIAGALATPELINATATLVITEREIALRDSDKPKPIGMSDEQVKQIFAASLTVMQPMVRTGD